MQFGGGDEGFKPMCLFSKVNGKWKGGHFEHMGGFCRKLAIPIASDYYGVGLL